MSENNARKASDVLLSLESKVDILSKQMQNLDANIKLILNRLLINSSQATVSNPVVQEISVKKTILPGLKENVVLGPNGLLIQETKSIQDTIQSKTLEEKDFDFPEANIVPLSSGRKVAVQQRITYTDGKNICLANVELKNLNGQIIKKMRTNAMGKWIAALDPGNYIVHIVKSANKTNQNVEMSFPITIPESDRPIELPSPKI